MNDRAVLSADEILELIRYQISQRCGELGNTFASDLGELDHDLFNWHWLYATITGRIEDFVSAAKSESKSEFLRFLELARSHEAVGVSDKTREILDRWKKRADAIGLTMLPG